MNMKDWIGRKVELSHLPEVHIVYDYTDKGVFFIREDSQVEFRGWHALDRILLVEGQLDANEQMQINTLTEPHRDSSECTE